MEEIPYSIDNSDVLWALPICKGPWLNYDGPVQGAGMVLLYSDRRKNLSMSNLVSFAIQSTAHLKVPRCKLLQFMWAPHVTFLSSGLAPRVPGQIRPKETSVRQQFSGPSPNP